MPKVTFGLNTAQIDYPIVAYPEVHVFEATMEALRRQTFKDFEVVIADCNYSKRSDYFMFHPEKFPVKHISVKPNIWHNYGLCAISTTKNTFLMYANGDIIISIGDCVTFDDKFIERTVQSVEMGYCTCSRYIIAEGKRIIVEDTRTPEYADIHGNVAMTAADWEEVNGYDECFDGSKGSEDLDLGYRVKAMGRSINIITTPITYQHHVTAPLSSGNCIKCQHLYWRMARRHQNGKIKANSKILKPDEFSYIRGCNNEKYPPKCPIFLTKCRIREEGKEAFSERCDRLVHLYKHPSLTFTLKEQRKDPGEAYRKLAEMTTLTKVEEFLDKEYKKDKGMEVTNNVFTESYYDKNYFAVPEGKKCKNLKGDDVKWSYANPTGEWGGCEPIAKAWKKVLNPETMLDVGAGRGTFLTYCRDQGIDACGFDYSSWAVSDEGRYSRCPSSCLIQHDATKPFPYNNDQFNLVICLDLMEHIYEEDIDKVISEMLRVSNKYIFLQIATSEEFEYTLKKGDVVPVEFATYALAGHVNVRKKDYWKNRFNQVGWKFNNEKLQEFISSVDELVISNWLKNTMLVLEKTNA